MSTTAPTLADLRQARARQGVVWRWLRLVGPVVVALTILAVAETRPHPSLRGAGLAISIALAAFGAGAFGALAARGGEGWLRPTFVGVLVAASAVLIGLQSGGPALLGPFVALAIVSRRVPARVGVVLTAAALVFVVVDATRSTGARPAPAGLVTGIAMAGLYGITLLARRLSETNERAEQLLIELDRTREAQARAAALAERQRLAREMHDILAHSLSGLTLQLEAAHILASTRDDDRLSGTIERARHLAKSGLDEARRAIGMLRGDALPGPDQLPTLFARFEQDTGTPCEFTITGNRRQLGSEVCLTLFRVAQESLTNIAKHARAARVTATLAYAPDRARLTVEDHALDGGGPLAVGETGYGLSGMRERAELLGGTLTAGSTRSGFLVELEIPA